MKLNLDPPFLRALSCTLPSYHPSQVSSMKLNLDPAAPNTCTRPLFYYFITDVLVTLTLP